ncbi:hypothetical protein GIB64_02505 [Pseudomonas lactis]|uniref:hypothetical protein n=1 Tax=Pseudomonas TaxID=286 RepID=UPI000D02E5AE|nr:MULTISPECIES: hypothetical protein [Pseudomonas]MBA5956290.1 hypothetical protein [Pseudomonas lactis]
MSELSQKPKANNAPTYMCLYPGLAEIARANGYALAVHGSLARDMDLIAVPWIDNPSSPEAVIAAIESNYGIRRIGDLTAAPHGRMVQTIGIQFGECFIDLSFMPSSGRNFNAGTASDAQPSGDHMESGEFNDPLYNAESDARNAAALLEEVLEWFDDGVGRSPEEFRLMRRIGDWLGRSVAEIKDSSDECAHSEADKIGCPECGEVLK